MAQPMMSGASDRRVKVEKHLAGSAPFKQEEHVVGPDINLGHKTMSVPIHEMGGKNPKDFSK